MSDFFKSLAKSATSAGMGFFGGPVGSVLANGLNSLYHKGGVTGYKKGGRAGLRPKPVKRTKRTRKSRK